MLSLLNTTFTNAVRGGASLVSKILSKLTSRADVIESEDCVKNALKSSAARKASFALIPSAYSDGEMHAALPDDGSGDLVFQRNTPAGSTRINSQGLVEEVSLLDDELVTNGTFETILGNELYDGGINQPINGGSWVDNLDGTFTVNGNGSPNKGIGVRDVNAEYLTIGKRYLIEVSESNIAFAIYSDTFSLIASGSNILYFTPTTLNTKIYVSPVDGITATYSNISVKEVIEGYIDETELITNGGFDDGLNGWNPTGSVAVTDGVVKINRDLGVAFIQTPYNPLTVGKKYKVDFDVLGDSFGSLAVWINALAAYPVNDLDGKFSQIIEATNTDFRIYASSGSELFIDNISVKEVVQDNWELGTGWSIDAVSGRAVQDGSNTSTSYCRQTLPVVLGDNLHLSIDVTVDAGSFTIIDGNAGTLILSETQSGTYTLNFNWSGSNGQLLLRAPVGFIGSIDNISVKEVIEEGIPRLNYDNIEYQDVLGAELVSNGDFETGEIGSVNLLQYSEDFSQWSTVNASAISGSKISVFGNSNTFSLTPDSNNVKNHRLQYDGFNLTNGKTYTLSCYVEKNGYESITINVGASRVYAQFGLTSETVLNSNSNGTNATNHIATIETFSADVFKVSLTFDVIDSAGLTYTRLVVNKDETLGTDGGQTYSGDGVSGIYVHGAQLEALPYATSYIKTEGGTQTRVNTTDWTFSTDYRINSGVLGSSTDSSGWIRNIASELFEVGKTYRASFEIKERIKGSMSMPYDDNSANWDFSQGTTVGVKTWDFVAKNNGNVTFYSSGFHGKIDNISVKEVLGQEVASSGCPSLLLEPQSTNSMVDSNLVVSQNDGQVFLDNDISPEGIQNAIKVIFGIGGSTGGGCRFDTLDSTCLPSKEYTFSFYAKSLVGDGKLRLRLDVDTQPNLINKEVTATNEWTRITHTFTTNSTASAFTNNSRIKSVTTNNEILFYGFQLEELPYATSYIPTSGGIATRSAETLRSGDISHLINSEEGVLYFEGSALAFTSQGRNITLSNGTGNYIRIFYSNTSSKVTYLVVANGSLVVNMSTGVFTQSDTVKIAVTWKLNEFKLYFNGTLINTDTVGATPVGLSKLMTSEPNGANSFHGNIKDLRIYKSIAEAQKDLTYIN